MNEMQQLINQLDMLDHFEPIRFGKVPDEHTFWHFDRHAREWAKWRRAHIRKGPAGMGCCGNGRPNAWQIQRSDFTSPAMGHFCPDEIVLITRDALQ